MIPFHCQHCRAVIAQQSDAELFIGEVLFRRRHIVFTHRKADGGCGGQNHWQPIERKPVIAVGLPKMEACEATTIGDFG